MKTAGNARPAMRNFLESLPIFGSTLKWLIWDPSCCVQGCECCPQHRGHSSALPEVKNREGSSGRELGGVPRAFLVGAVGKARLLRMPVHLLPSSAHAALPPARSRQQVLPAGFLAQSRAGKQQSWARSRLLLAEPRGRESRLSLVLLFISHYTEVLSEQGEPLTTN